MGDVAQLLLRIRFRAAVPGTGGGRAPRGFDREESVPDILETFLGAFPGQLGVVHGSQPRERLFLPPERGPFILIAWGLIHPAIGLLYYVILHARYGQTLGKMVTRVQVLDLSEERIPTLRQAFLRDIGYIVISTVSLVYLIYLIITLHYRRGAHIPVLPGQILAWAGLGWLLPDIVTMATNHKLRALHDYIAGTVVVRKAAQSV
jgi:uncharacterized RDD family membrane protein YckC